MADFTPRLFSSSFRWSRNVCFFFFFPDGETKIGEPEHLSTPRPPTKAHRWRVDAIKHLNRKDVPPSVARGRWEGSEERERGPHFINVLMATCILIENNQIKPPLQTDISRWALYLRGPRRGPNCRALKSDVGGLIACYHPHDCLGII